jgi:hypothetical protein
MLKLREKNLISDERRERALDTCCAGVFFVTPLLNEKNVTPNFIEHRKNPRRNHVFFACLTEIRQAKNQFCRIIFSPF